jgi:hypothetical protein
MANKQLKRLKRTARKEKNKIVSKYMTDNWDQVLVSSVNMIRRFNFKVRFTIAMQIIFRPDKKNRFKKLKSPEKQPEIINAA